VPCLDEERRFSQRPSRQRSIQNGFDDPLLQQANGLAIYPRPRSAANSKGWLVSSCIPVLVIDELHIAAMRRMLSCHVA